MTSVRRVLSVATLSLLGYAVAEAAPIPAINTSVTAGSGGITSAQVDGFRFSLSGSISVTDLGVFDDSLNGLGAAHTVSLWTDSLTLLTSVVVPSGTGGLLVGSFRYQALGVPYVLGPGIYRVAASYGNTDPDLYSATASYTTAPGVTWLGAYYGNTTPDTFASFFSGGIYGANFRFEEAAAIPEPATLTLLGSGLLGLRAGVRRRRARRVH